jgi:hypothetical protein
MFEIIKTLGIIWTAMILTYGMIAIVLVTTRWTFRTLKRVLFQIGHCENQIRPLRVETGQYRKLKGYLRSPRLRRYFRLSAATR